MCSIVENAIDGVQNKCKLVNLVKKLVKHLTFILRYSVIVNYFIVEDQY